MTPPLSQALPVSLPQQPLAPSHRKTAIAVGVLFIACSAAAILSALPTGSLLDASDYLNQLAAHDGRVIIGSIIEFIWAVTGAAIAVALYPVLRKYNRGLALGAACGRVVEGVFVVVGTLGLVTLLTLGQKAAGSADPSAFSASGDLLVGLRDWCHGYLSLIPFLLGALMYYCVMYRWRLVPRWLSGWGVVGVVLGLAATIYSAFTQDFGLTSLNSALNAPIGVQEMVLAVWLIVKGFNKTAPATASAGQAWSCPTGQDKTVHAW